MVAEGRRGEGAVRGFGIDICTLLCLKWTTTKDLLYSIGPLLKVLWQPGGEGSLGGDRYVCIYG